MGGGQATLPFLQTGCKFCAVEYGKHLSELCREKFKDYPNFTVITDKFENVDFVNEAYNLVFSASAFHWVPEKIGYPKVYAMLKSGGVFARFANHPYRDKYNPALAEEIDKVYGLYYYKLYDRKQEYPKEYSEEDARLMAEIAVKYGFAEEIAKPITRPSTA